MAENNTNNSTDANDTNNSTAQIDNLTKEVGVLKGIINSAQQFFKKEKDADDKTNKKEEAAKKDDASIDYKKEIEILQKKYEDANKKIEEMVKVKLADEQAKKDSEIQNAINKAKENGFILPDDKEREKWLRNALQMDYAGTMIMIEEASKNSKINKKPELKKEERKTLAKSIARESMEKFIY